MPPESVENVVNALTYAAYVHQSEHQAALHLQTLPGPREGCAVCGALAHTVEAAKRLAAYDTAWLRQQAQFMQQRRRRER